MIGKKRGSRTAGSADTERVRDSGSTYAKSEKVVTKRMLLEQVWDDGGNFVEENTLHVTLNRLKRRSSRILHILCM